MDEKVLKSAIKGMELLAKQNGVTMLIAVHDPETDWCNDLICGNDEEVIGTLVNFICTVYAFIDKSKAEDLNDVLDFVKENWKVVRAIRRMMQKIQDKQEANND